MLMYYPEKILLKCGKEIIIRHLQPNDADLYANCLEQIFKKATYELCYTEQIVDIAFLKEKCEKAKKLHGN